ncbi:MAG: hypothetical protein IPN98_06505 [Propionivibrio sp.]|nr:hypothetical protein [Propionivibrio sp.]
MKEALAWLEHCKALSPAIVETCAKTAVSSGPGALIKALGQALPEWKFRHSLSRGGWYRLGGVLDKDGNRISDSLENWAENALDERGGDFGQLTDDFADQQLYATRLMGQTHYLVAAAGDRCGRFSATGDRGSTGVARTSTVRQRPCQHRGAGRSARRQ